MTGAGARLVEEVRRDSEGGRHACGRAPVSDPLFRQERGSQEEAAMPARETERYDSRNWLYASTWR